jgi:RNA polymerase sigma-70 factor (ECF subfamily)
MPRFADANLPPDHEAEVIAAIRAGHSDLFETFVVRYQAKVFATVRRYARGESDAEDLAQNVFIKAFQKLDSYRGEAPFEHWLMRLTIRTCYDHLRARQRRRETALADLAEEEHAWLERYANDPSSASDTASGARELVEQVLSRLAPASRLMITLLEIEDRPVKEVARLMDWSVPRVKVRAFRARREMRRLLERLLRDQNL